MSEVPLPVASPRVFLGHVYFLPVSDTQSLELYRYEPIDKLHKATQNHPKHSLWKNQDDPPTGFRNFAVCFQLKESLRKLAIHQYRQTTEQTLACTFRDTAEGILEIRHGVWIPHSQLLGWSCLLQPYCSLTLLLEAPEGAYGPRTSNYSVISHVGTTSLQGIYAFCIPKGVPCSIDTQPFVLGRDVKHKDAFRLLCLAEHEHKWAQGIHPLVLRL